MIYICIVILGMLLLMIEKNRIVNTKYKNVVIKFDLSHIYLLLLIMCFFICAFKADSIGIDTKSYLNLYNSSEQYILGYLNKFHSEYLFYLFIFISKIGNFDFHTFLFIYYIIAFYCLYFFIKKYSKEKITSIIVFIAFGYLFLYMSALRQIMAMSIILLYYDAILEDKKFKALLLLIIAIGFHKSAVICGLAFILFFINLDKKRVLIFGILMIIISYIIPSEIIVVLGNRLGYFEYIDLLGQSSNIFLIIIHTIMNIGLLIFNYVNESKINTKLVFLLTLGTCLYITSMKLFLISRMAYYFQIVIIVCYGNILLIYKKVSNINKVFFILCLIVYFTITINYDGLQTYHYKTYVTEKEDMIVYEES